VTIVQCDGDSGRELVLVAPPYRTSDGEPWSFQATLTTEDANATAIVWEYRRGPEVFFRELADAWQGSEGEKSYASLEGELRLDCRHDGRGLVVCDVSLGRQSPPTWRLSAELSFGAGAHLERIAGELEAAFQA
jgi:hypothetical protein